MDDGENSAARRRFFTLSPRLEVLPVVHGSADFALLVKDRILAGGFDCIAVPLPESFKDEVMAGVRELPAVSVVVQPTTDDFESPLSYVPIDPCQPVIRAISVAIQERIPVAFIDLEAAGYERANTVYPDPYAIRTLDLLPFSAAVLAFADAPETDSPADLRQRRMAFELHRLELEHKRILFLPNVLDWPWIHAAYVERLPYPEHAVRFAPVSRYGISRRTLYFFLAELPYITRLYDERRVTSPEDDSLTIDGVKELVLEARDRLIAKRPRLKPRVTLKALRLYLQYARNLTLIRHRLRPDLITLVEAAKQTAGDDFAIAVLETAKDYGAAPESRRPEANMGIDRAEFPDQGVRLMESRLPGHAVVWRPLHLISRPDPQKRMRIQQSWNPYTQCSWPPEDGRIESFNLHVREQARNMISSDLARTEKFTASLKDGLDIRETLRNWHTGELFVREVPPSRGNVEVVVFLFEVPADPAVYSWCSTWFAENVHESTLAFYATNYLDDIIGPGIAQARYGGAFFLFPPRPIPDVWLDRRFKELSLEERLLAGALVNTKERYVAVVSPCALKATWRRLARRFQKQLVHLPLRRFSTSLVERLRHFHVLNDRKVRSYAADFIRRPE